MAKAFGKTWWGQKWLEAFTDIDDTGRLSRGKTYARKGSVFQKQIRGTAIEAKIKGSKTSPYSAYVEMKEFNETDKKIILETLQKRPELWQQLTQRQLPKDLFDILEQEDINLFPKRWRDFKAACSCPDFAMPCKHIAAVIYSFSEEIDANPFLIFLLHDFDLLSYIEKNAQKQKMASMPKWEEKWHLLDEIEELPEPKEIENIDISFAQIPNLEQTLLQLLSPNPPFFEKEDFKSILQTTYQKLPKTIDEYWKDYETEEEREEDRKYNEEFYAKNGTKNKKEDKNYYEIERFEFTFDASYKLRNTFKITTEKRKLKKIKIDNGLGFLLDLFYTLPTTEIKRLSEQLQVLFKIHQFALSLLERGAIVPTIFSNQKKEVFIRWQPAVLNENVKEILTQISETLDIRTVNIGLKSQNKEVTKTKIEPHYADQLESTLTILGIILHFYIEETWIKTRYKKRLSSLNMKIESIFFMNLAMNFTGYQEKDMPHLVRAWLGKFLLSERKYVPILSIQENFEEEETDYESINNYEEADETFSLEILIEDKEHQHKHDENKTPHIPLAVIFEDDSFEEVRLPIVQDLQILSDFLVEIRDIIKSQGQVSKEIEATRLSKILSDIFPVLQILGIKILLPKRLEKIVRPRLKASLNSKNKKEESFLKLGNVWDFDWEIAMGEDKISAADFEKMIAQKIGLWRFRDQYVLLDEKEIALIVEQLKKKKKKLSNAELLQTALTEEYQGTKVELSEKVKALLQGLKEAPKIEIPQNLKATLRPYQQVGYEWLYQNAKLGLGSILADDMGLGKTLQTITFLLKLKEENQLGGNNQPALIVLPTTLLSNWQREIEKFAPSLSFYIYHGAKRKWLESEKDNFKPDIWLTTYGTVRSEDKRFAEREWSCVVIDEAQAIKNPAAGQTEAIKMLQSPRKIALSGTPVENRLSEYWSIFDFVNENYLDVLSVFRTNFSIPIERDRDEHKSDIFKKMTAPFIMRRLKTDKSIIDDLPEKIEKDQICNLTKEQTLLYETTLREGMKVVEEHQGIKRRGVILKLMMQLKQICNHPAQFLKESTMKISNSGKTKLLLEIVKQIYEADEKVLIFTQYTKMGELLKDFLQSTFHTEVPFLHGGLTRKGRDKAVETFQNEEHCPFMVLSLKAGGTGLNLTSASHVIHFDLWWNPAVEAQATDRAYRIGQKNNVLVHRMITKGTLEEKINELLQSKKEIADLAITTNNAWITEMNTGELHELFALKDL
ncbi:DNA/RNA helicase, superfamily II, SNF2 family [Bernardetia litoralis DSM 6794]|uniref:DNA/RNA helicase, superfamily II, SNF2 family n=1 Tax=Bernardetia litoralis (strain ATCC 23117 / DSM 6794 / NBRC 15988 / NCIMB 1366 / Fx l1 / Sio-4) TaxID=880071 RepID=I4AIZ8_BERLS|nr:DEAD/DEAH box helicase [Bernardetia litoralis]AFM03933.1 DNA/RNA helicase, superfamily II, SNF2 family [Bernardetia litoralis DSM 6794]